MLDDTLRIGIVPSEGEDAAYGRAVAVSPRNDLALIEITEGNLRLPPLTIAGGPVDELHDVSAVGYPMNVDQAQRSEEHTSELQSLMRISYAVFCLKKKKKTNNNNQ